MLRKVEQRAERTVIPDVELMYGMRVEVPLQFGHFDIEVVDDVESTGAMQRSPQRPIARLPPKDVTRRTFKSKRPKSLPIHLFMVSDTGIRRGGEASDNGRSVSDSWT